MVLLFPSAGEISVYTPTPASRMVLRRKPSPPPLESRASQTSRTTHYGGLPPYFMSWDDSGRVLTAAGSIPMATSQFSSDQACSPRKTTVAASILFGANGKAPVTQHRAARSKEIPGENISFIETNTTITPTRRSATVFAGFSKSW